MILRKQQNGWRNSIEKRWSVEMASFFSRVYAIGYSEKKEDGLKNIYNDYKIIKNRLFSWCADPFPIEYNGELYIFAELFKFKGCKGVIAYTKKNDSGFDKWKIVIEEPYHLSFPNIFMYKNKFYMCPEANESKEIYLYECKKFPDKWEKAKVLIRGGYYCDTIFYKDKGRVYGLTYNLNGDLDLFDCQDDCKFSKGKIHTSSEFDNRPAGCIFQDGKYGDVIVSQIGKPRYGSGLVFKKVCVNWPDYSEKEILRIYPENISCNRKKKYNGVHTFNMSEHFCVIDVIYDEVDIIEKLFKIFYKLKRMIKNGND